MRRVTACCVVLLGTAAGHCSAGAEAPAPLRTRSLGQAAWEDTFLTGAGEKQLRLSHAPLLWGSERVLADGKTLVAGRDYSLDHANGSLVLSRPLPAGAVVTVSFRAPALLKAETAGPGALGAPQRTALTRRLSSALGSARLELGAETASRETAPPQENIRDQLLSGLRLTQHSDHIEGRGKDTATVSYLRADPLDPQTAGAGREEFTSNLDLRPSNSSRLRLLNSFSRESLFTEDYEEIERRRLQFDQTIGKSTAALLWERRRSDGRGIANSLDALSLTLTHPFSRNTFGEGYFALEESLYRGRETESLVSMRQRLGQALQAQAGLQFRTSEFSGYTAESAFTLVAQPRAGSDLTLAVRQADSERYGRYQRFSADLNSAISSRLQLMGELSRRTSQQYGSIDTFGLGLAARPTGYSLLETAFSESTGELLGREQTQTVRLAVDPSAGLRLQLGYDRTHSARDGQSQNGLWILTIGGERYLKVEGYAALHQPKDEPRFNDSLYRLELRPIEPLAFSAQLRRVLLDEQDRSVAGVGASLRLWRALELAAAYRQPTMVGELQPEQGGKDFKLSLAPISRFRVFGQYSVRPEDDRGGLLDQIHRSLGLETSLGSLALTGSVTRMEGRLAADPGQRLDLLATLTVGDGTRLYGGIRTQDPVSVEQQRSRIYRLGISQSAGTAFVLLEGQFGWEVDGMGTRSWSAEDALAQARLGFRF